MGTAAQYDAIDLYAGLRNSIEGFGCAITLGGKKRYIFGQLPMADVFIAWSHSRVPPDWWNAQRPVRFATIMSLTVPLLLLGALIWYLWKPLKKNA